MSENWNYYGSRVSLLLGFTCCWIGYALTFYSGAWGFDGPGYICTPEWLLMMPFKGLALMILGALTLIFYPLAFTPRHSWLLVFLLAFSSLAVSGVASWFLLPQLGRAALTECCAGNVKDADSEKSCERLRQNSAKV